MNITLTIQAPELVGALENLATALGTANPLAGVELNTDSKVFTADKKIEDKKPAKPPTQKAKPKAEEPAPEEEAAPFAQVEEPPVEDEPEEPESNISLDVVTTKTREFIQSNPANRSGLKGFLDSRGAKKVTDLEPDQYQALLDYMDGAAE